MFISCFGSVLALGQACVLEGDSTKDRADIWVVERQAQAVEVVRSFHLRIQLALGQSRQLQDRQIPLVPPPVVLPVPLFPQAKQLQ